MYKQKVLGSIAAAAITATAAVSLNDMVQHAEQSLFTEGANPVKSVPVPCVWYESGTIGSLPSFRTLYQVTDSSRATYDSDRTSTISTFSYNKNGDISYRYHRSPGTNWKMSLDGHRRLTQTENSTPGATNAPYSSYLIIYGDQIHPDTVITSGGNRLKSGNNRTETRYILEESRNSYRIEGAFHQFQMGKTIDKKFTGSVKLIQTDDTSLTAEKTLITTMADSSDTTKFLWSYRVNAKNQLVEETWSSSEYGKIVRAGRQYVWEGDKKVRDGYFTITDGVHGTINWTTYEYDDKNQLTQEITNTNYTRYHYGELPPLETVAITSPSNRTLQNGIAVRGKTLEISLANSAATDLSVSLITPLGKQIALPVEQSAISQGRLNLSVGHIAPGVYIVRLNQNKTSVTQRIIIQ